MNTNPTTIAKVAKIIESIWVLYSSAPEQPQSVPQPELGLNSRSFRTSKIPK